VNRPTFDHRGRPLATHTTGGFHYASEAAGFKEECGKQDLNLHDLAATRPST
jgi:hypothetical protein